MTERIADNPPLTLPQIARQLGDERLSRVVASYGEYHASLRRVIFLAAVTGWTYFWARLAGPPSAGNTLPIEAQQLLPWVPLMLWIATVWMVAIRRRWLESHAFADAAGSAANILGIGLMLHNAWNISISMIAVLPFTTILIGARLGRRAFYASMLCTVLVVGLAAPAGYWVHRPAFIPFALLLLCGLPMTVNRLLATVAELSRTAIESRNAQSRFLATMSHELRTPLNTVIHSSALIDTTPLSDEDTAAMRNVQVNARALLQRVNDVLDVAAIAARRLQILREPFLLRRVVRQVRELMEPLAERKGLTLEVNELAAPELRLLGDASRLEQALTNLLGNAIKFTPVDGTVWLEVTADAQQVCFNVSDTGIGIADADKSRVCEAFYQVGSGHSRAHGGVGLGLHIVKTFCELSQGTLDIADRPGGGSRIRLALPRLDANPDTPVPDEADTVLALEAHGRRFTALDCLVVDDNAPNRDIIERLLRRAGHRVQVACSGQQALDALAEPGRFDLLLLDMHMPDMSGMDVLAWLQQHGAGGAPVVAMLSADSDPHTMQQAMTRGAAAYLTKPIVIGRLLALLERLASPRSTETPAATPDTGDDVAVAGVISIPLLRRLVSRDELTRYLQLSDRELARGLQALADCRETPARMTCLHRLKNTFVAIDHAGGRDACTVLQRAIDDDRPTGQALATLDREVTAARHYLASQPEFSPG